MTSGHYLAGADLLDPWGQAYAYAISAGGFRVSGYDAEGQPDEDLLLSHRFTAVQRMMMTPEAPDNP